MPNENSKPNIFNYATKELSQDAMICWLIKWAGHKAQSGTDEKLRNYGRKFVQALLGKHNIELGDEENIRKPEIHQQNKGIDVLARINDEYVLLIEDKIDAPNRGNQLETYYETVRDGKTKLKNVAEDCIYPIYLKTGNQSRAKDRSIENIETTGRGYKVFNRANFLEVLKPYESDDSILTDFGNHLQEWEDDTNSFEDWMQLERKNWSWKSWEGFFRHLEGGLQFIDGRHNWGYVSNKGGGFRAFWWHVFDFEWEVAAENYPYCIYLQLEIHPENPNRQKLCFKVNTKGWINNGATKEERDLIRNEQNPIRVDLKHMWYELIFEAGPKQIDEPLNWDADDYMTVARWNEDWLAFDANGELDVEGTVENLGNAQNILTAAVDNV